jgi:hypothetical protein
VSALDLGAQDLGHLLVDRRLALVIDRHPVKRWRRRGRHDRANRVV